MKNVLIFILIYQRRNALGKFEEFDFLILLLYKTSNVTNVIVEVDIMEKLRALLYFSTALTIIPLVNFNNNYTLKRRMLYKIYAVNYYITMLIFQMYCFYYLYIFRELMAEPFQSFEMTLLIESIIEIIELMDNFITSMGSSFWNIQKFEDYFKNYAKIHNLFLTKKKSYFFRNFDPIFLANIFIFTLIFFSGNHILSIELKYTPTSKYLIRYYIKYSTKCIKFSLLFWQLYGIYLAYRKMNTLLKKSNLGNRIINLNTIESWHIKLSKLIQDINNLFGIQLFLGIIQISMHLLYYLNIIRREIQISETATVILYCTSMAILLSVRFF